MIAQTVVKFHYETETSNVSCHTLLQLESKASATSPERGSWGKRLLFYNDIYSINNKLNNVWYNDDKANDDYYPMLQAAVNC